MGNEVSKSLVKIYSWMNVNRIYNCDESRYALYIACEEGNEKEVLHLIKNGV